MANRSDSTRTDPSASLRSARPAAGRAGSPRPTPPSSPRAARATHPAAEKPTAQAITNSSVKATPRLAREAKAKLAPTAAMADDERRVLIAKAAYFNAERRGFAPGGEVGDWLAAEAEVDALLAHSGGIRQ